jgi:hypothetical protein
VFGDVARCGRKCPSRSLAEPWCDTTQELGEVLAALIGFIARKTREVRSFPLRGETTVDLSGSSMLQFSNVPCSLTPPQSPVTIVPQHQDFGFKPSSRLEAVAEHADEKGGNSEHPTIMF